MSEKRQTGTSWCYHHHYNHHHYNHHHCDYCHQNYTIIIPLIRLVALDAVSLGGHVALPIKSSLWFPPFVFVSPAVTNMSQSFGRHPRSCQAPLFRYLCGRVWFFSEAKIYSIMGVIFSPVMQFYSHFWASNASNAVISIPYQASSILMIFINRTLCKYILWLLVLFSPSCSSWPCLVWGHQFSH